MEFSTLSPAIEMGKLTLVLAACAVILAPSVALDCPFPFEMIGTQCLLFDTLESGSYYDMRLYCTRQEAGATLAKIPSATQLSEIIAYILKYGLDHSSYWIDASDDDVESYWRWSDGTSVPMGAPLWRYDCDEALTLRPAYDTTRNCAILDQESHYLIADTSCLDTNNPICEVPL
ncbi:type-2 ice-structuring protein-like [Macrobrachium rosenbergii]|uniref:type-2 ice-structuring protein-like n=1 Tax=Macrobrachium rosenbergii TaxID=79674 RepID=UPI0034D61EB8